MTIKTGLTLFSDFQLNNKPAKQPIASPFIPRTLLTSKKSPSRREFRDVKDRHIVFSSGCKISSFLRLRSSNASLQMLIENDGDQELNDDDQRYSLPQTSSGNTSASSDVSPNSITDELTNVNVTNLPKFTKNGPSPKESCQINGFHYSSQSSYNNSISISSERREAQMVSRKRTFSNSLSGNCEIHALPKIILNGWYGCDKVRNRAHGVGLYNPSNNCFLNSVLQAIVHTGEFSRYIIESGNDPRICQLNGHPCLHCELRKHIISAINFINPFEPKWIKSFLPRIFPHHRFGSQEDAHEMLTLLLGALEPLPPKQINGVQKLNPTAQSPIEQIFGGTLKNEIFCHRCNQRHTNFEKIREMNLGLGLSRFSNARSMDSLIDDFFKDEIIQNFECSRCKSKNPASRKTYLIRPPHVLIIQLKRFNQYGGKNRIPVTPKISLNLEKYLSQTQNPPRTAKYVLNGLIEHIGSGLNFGHYVCAMRGFNGKDWYKFDDSEAYRIDENVVRNRMEPYILFFTRNHHSSSNSNTHSMNMVNSRPSLNPFSFNTSRCRPDFLNRSME